jgi:hypothetical protein
MSYAPGPSSFLMIFFGSIRTDLPNDYDEVDLQLALDSTENLSCVYAPGPGIFEPISTSFQSLLDVPNFHAGAYMFSLYYPKRAVNLPHRNHSVGRYVSTQKRSSKKN